MIAPATRQIVARALARRGRVVHRSQPFDLLPWGTPTNPQQATRARDAATLNGDPRTLINIFDRFRFSDLTLGGILKTRIQAIKANPWEIIPASDAPRASKEIDKDAAAKAAEFVKLQIAAMDGWEEFVNRQLQDGILYGVAVSELLWKATSSGHEIREILSVPGQSLRALHAEPSIVRVFTEEALTTGQPIWQFPNKFVEHRPDRIGESPWAGGLMTSLTIWAAVKRLAWHWFQTASERWGQPYLKGTFGAGTNEGDKDDMEEMLESFGNSGWGLFHENMNLELIEAGRAADQLPTVVMIDKIDKHYAIFVLGNELSTQTSESGGGAMALGKVHQLVREDIRDADIEAEAKTIREQILTRMIAFGPDPNAPVPFFRRDVPEQIDEKAEAEKMSTARNDLGIPITFRDAYRKLNIPMPPGVDPEGFIPGRPEQAPTSFGGFGSFSEALAARSIALRQLGLPEPEDAHAPVRDLPQPGREDSPFVTLRQWVDQGVDKGRRQVREVVDVVLRTLKLGARSSKRITAAKRKDIAKQLGAMLSKLPAKEFAGSLETYLTASQLAGFSNAQTQLKREDPETLAAAGVSFSSSGKNTEGRTVVAAEPDLEDFTRPFEEAIKALKQRIILSSTDFERLARAARNRAGRIAGFQNARLVETVYNELLRIMRENGTLTDFRDAIAEIPGAKKWGTTNPTHLRLVFQQNATMAYAAGRRKQIDTAGVKAYRWMARRDSCPICTPYIGRVFLYGGFPEPGGAHFNCDCWDKIVLRPRGKAVRIESVDNPRFDDSQKPSGALKFDSAQFGSMEPFDLSTVPPELRSAFRSHLAQNS